MPYIGNSPKNNVRGRFYYTASASQTLFSGADIHGRTLAYQDGGYVDVYLNGVLLQDTTDYTATTKTSVTLVSGATAGDLVEIIAYGIFSVADTVSASSGGEFAGDVTFSADANFGDSNKAQFGAGNDLQIYHDGTDSYITDAGTGDLILTSSTAHRVRTDQFQINNAANTEQMIQAVADGAVTLRYDGSAKLATTSTGIDVTGNVDASGTVFGTNQILQVQKVTLSSTTQLTSSGANHELSTSLRLAITPKASDSLLYLNFFAPFTYPGSNNLSYANFYDVTNSTAVGVPAAGGSRRAVNWHKRTTAFDANDMDNINLHAVITANNTNARTYTIYHSTEGAVAQFLQSTLSTSAGTNTVAFFWIMEVAA